MNKVTDCYNTLRETDQRRREAIDALFSDVVSSAKVTSKLVLSVVPLSKQHYLGSVAARLRDYYRRNSIIIGTRDDKCVGELRSCGLDLYELLYKFRELFIDFGGHKKAAGFSMKKENLDGFLEYVQQYVNGKDSDMKDDCNSGDSNAETHLRRADVEILRRLVPFGEGNPPPVLTDGISRYTVDNTMKIIDKD